MRCLQLPTTTQGRSLSLSMHLSVSLSVFFSHSLSPSLFLMLHKQHSFGYSQYRLPLVRCRQSTTLIFPCLSYIIPLSILHSLFFILSDLPSPPLCSSDASFRLPMCMSVKHFTFHGGIINCVTNATRQLKCNKQVIIASVHGTQSYCIYSTVLYVSYVDKPTLTSALGRHISGGALTRSTCSSASDEVYYVIST